MQNKFLVFVLVIIILSGLAFKPALAKDNKNQPVFEIQPKKSFGVFKFGDSRNNIENKLKPILKNKCYCKDDHNHTIFNCIDCLKEPLNFYFDDDKFNGITWDGFGLLKYKNQIITKLKTNYNDIRKLFPGGKSEYFISDQSFVCRYYDPKKGIMFDFIPIENLYYIGNDDEKIKLKKIIKNTYCFNHKYTFKYYKCYSLVTFYMSKDKEELDSRYNNKLF